MQEVDLLLVEDDEQLAFVVTEAGKLTGISVHHVRSAGEALTALKTWEPRLILLDLLLPDKSGIEVAQQLRTNTGLMHIPIILWSNYTDSPALQKQRYLFDKIVSKPGAAISQFLKEVVEPYLGGTPLSSGAYNRSSPTGGGFS